MKKDITSMLHTGTTECMREFLNSMGHIKIVNKLEDRLKERGISQKQFSILTGLRRATICEFINMKKVNINLGHLIMMMCVLQISSISEIIDVEFSPELLDEMAINKARWVNNQEMPETINKLILERLLEITT